LFLFVSLFLFDCFASHLFSLTFFWLIVQSEPGRLSTKEKLDDIVVIRDKEHFDELCAQALKADQPLIIDFTGSNDLDQTLMFAIAHKSMLIGLPSLLHFSYLLAASYYLSPCSRLCLAALYFPHSHSIMVQTLPTHLPRVPRTCDQTP
jgi:hypothetical protein